MSDDPRTRRERIYGQTVRDIKAIARRQMENGGAGEISMNAIAREMGITGPALFRYFPNREALLTDLVAESYEELAATMERANTSLDPDMTEQVLRDQAALLREWALTNPQRYLFIFGTPVPGFHPPAERTAPAAMRLLASAIAPLVAIAPDAWEASDDPFDREMEGWAVKNGIPPMPARLLKQAFQSWTRLHGVLSLELVGHFTDRLPDPAGLYQSETDALIEIVREYLPDAG